MRRSVSTSIFITMLSGLHILTPSVRAAANRTTIQDERGTIQSPNFGYELGKKADSVWRFYMREGKVLKLKLTDLKIFYCKDNYYEGGCDNTCGDSYRLFVNQVKEDCMKYIRGGRGGDKQKYYFFYSTPSCFEVEFRYGCSQLKVDTGFVEVAYHADGGKRIHGRPSTMSGFRMTYKYLDCPADGTNSSDETTAIVTMNTTPTSISTATMTLAPKSNAIVKLTPHPQTVGSLTHRETTQSDCDITSANAVTVAGSNEAFIYGSIGGGIVFAILLALAAFCIVRMKKKTTQGNSNAGRHYDDVRVPISSPYMDITSNTSQPVYHEVEASLLPQTSQRSYNVSSSATAQVAMTLVETPGYQTVTFNSGQAVGSRL